MQKLALFLIYGQRNSVSKVSVWKFKIKIPTEIVLNTFEKIITEHIAPGC